MAARATFALNAALCRVRVLFIFRLLFRRSRRYLHHLNLWSEFWGPLQTAINRSTYASYASGAKTSPPWPLRSYALDETVTVSRQAGERVDEARSARQRARAQECARARRRAESRHGRASGECIS